MDKSLKGRGELVRHRNVLTRAERVAGLLEQGRLADPASVFGLPKVANRKVRTRKKAPAKAAAAPAEGAAPAAATPADAKKPEKGAEPKGKA
jgi:small basic protein (TIGR04137 family)